MGMFDFASDVLGLAEAGAGIAGLFGRKKKSAYEQQNEQQSARANAISEALTNPSSPMFTNLANNHIQLARDARLRGIRDFVSASTRSAKRLPTGPGFIASNPRRDEALMRALMEGGQNEQAQGDLAARADLMGQLTGQTQAANISRGGVPIAWEGQQRRGSVWPGALGAARDVAGSLERSWDSYGPGANPVGGNINESPMTMTNRNFGRGASGMLGWV